MGGWQYHSPGNSSPRMSLNTRLEQLEPIAAVICAELSLIRAMRADGEPPELEAEVAAYAAGLAQIALLQSPLLLEALELETAAALAEA